MWAWVCGQGSSKRGAGRPATSTLLHTPASSRRRRRKGARGCRQQWRSSPRSSPGLSSPLPPPLNSPPMPALVWCCFLVSPLPCDHSLLPCDHSLLPCDHSLLAGSHSLLTCSHSPLTCDHSPLTCQPCVSQWFAREREREREREGARGVPGQTCAGSRPDPSSSALSATRSPLTPSSSSRDASAGCSPSELCVDVGGGSERARGGGRCARSRGVRATAASSSASPSPDLRAPSPELSRARRASREGRWFFGGGGDVDG
eukprot:1939893-Rhodomonas_salina.1